MYSLLCNTQRILPRDPTCQHFAVHFDESSWHHWAVRFAIFLLDDFLQTCQGDKCSQDMQKKTPQRSKGVHVKPNFEETRDQLSVPLAFSGG